MVGVTMHVTYCINATYYFSSVVFPFSFWFSLLAQLPVLSSSHVFPTSVEAICCLELASLRGETQRHQRAALCVTHREHCQETQGRGSSLSVVQKWRDRSQPGHFFGLSYAFLNKGKVLKQQRLIKKLKRKKKERKTIIIHSKST